MYTKWLPLIVGKPGAEILCPLPSDDIMKGVKDDKNAKAGQKRAAKRKINEVAIVSGTEDILPVQENAMTVVEQLAIEQEVQNKYDEDTV